MDIEKTAKLLSVWCRNTSWAKDCAKQNKGGEPKPPKEATQNKGDEPKPPKEATQDPDEEGCETGKPKTLSRGA